MTNNYINKSSFEKSGSTVYVVLMYYIYFIYILLQREIFLDFILAVYAYGLRTPREEIAFTARPKIKSQSQILSIFCLPHWPKTSDFFDLCLHWVSVVCLGNHMGAVYFRGWKKKL
jgi:phosphatidylglycerophosphate synthase